MFSHIMHRKMCPRHSLLRKIVKANAFEKKEESIQNLRRECNRESKKNIVLLQERELLQKERDRAVGRYFCFVCARM